MESRRTRQHTRTYGGYYDAVGTLHVKHADMPVDSEGFPLKSYTDEEGQPRLNKADKEKARADEERVLAGGTPDDGLTEEEFWNLRR